MNLYLLLIIIIMISVVVSGLYEIQRKNIHIWLLPYLNGKLHKTPRPRNREPVHVVFCFVDHYEPMRGGASNDIQSKRVDAWLERYPILAAKHKDSVGKHPQHTFFYPAEEYSKEHLNKLRVLCKAGFGEVEIHLHHDKDTADGLQHKIETFKEQLRELDLLSKDEHGRAAYGFIHGNWALDNSRKDGRYCGVNNELLVLKLTGCYADFTLPSAPSDTQTHKINSLYYATDDPLKPKSHNSGVDVEVGRKPTGDLMIVQGPLTLDWKNRKWGIFPRTENAEIASNNPPRNSRIDLWIRQHIHVLGEPNWIFVKVHTHGCQEEHNDVLLGQQADAMYSYLENSYNDGVKYCLHYMTAREMYLTIKKIEAGQI